MLALNLSDADRDQCLANIAVLDLRGKNFRLCELDRGGNASTTSDVDFFIEAYRDLDLGLTIFDPLVSFGAAETAVNVAAQAPSVPLGASVVSSGAVCGSYITFHKRPRAMALAINTVHEAAAH
ncbi:MAG: hypothetical protein ACREV2_13465 [Burkholderiales bacterium]